MKECDLDFTLCNTKCTDCVDCIQEQDRKNCKAYREDVIEYELFECLVEYPGCQQQCPRKLMFPKCTACCQCLDYHERAWTWLANRNVRERDRMMDFIPIE